MGLPEEEEEEQSSGSESRKSTATDVTAKTRGAELGKEESSELQLMAASHCKDSQDLSQAEDASSLQSSDGGIEPCNGSSCNATDEVKEEPEEPSEEDLESGIRFFPPAYIQRYSRVRDALETCLKKLQPESSATILEVGCAEFGMHYQFKSLPNVQKVVYVDLDKELLERKLFAVKPLPMDYLSPRESPFSVEVYAGCVTQADSRIKNSDPPLFAIVGIEILEHLDKDVEEKFVYTLFKKYAPPVVILTTPNGDFNPIFSLEKGKFRHWDHRFELTREEFQDWCVMVCENFPQYRFHIEGITDGPPGTESLGCLSQMAVFERKEDFQKGSIIKEYKFQNEAFRVDRITEESPQPVVKDLDYFERQSSDEPYELLHTVEYVWKPKAPLRERVISEIVYHIHTYLLGSYSLDTHYENGGGEVISMDDNKVRRILMNKFSEEVLDVPNDMIASWLEEKGLKVIRNGASFRIDVDIPDDSSFSDYSDDDAALDDKPAFNIENSEVLSPATNVISADSEEDWD